MKIITLPNAHADLMKEVIGFYISARNDKDSSFYDPISDDVMELLLESYAEFIRKE